MARKKEIDRDRILDAAVDVILESGGRHLTLDAVAERAGISKGGLVYSFATKDDLVAAALEREMVRFDAAVDARVGSETSNSERWLLGHIDELINEDEELARKAAFLMIALVQAPQIPDAIRQSYRGMFDRFIPYTSRGRDIRQAVLAVEGLFLLRGFGLAVVSNDDWQSVLEHARATIDASSSASSG